MDSDDIPPDTRVKINLLDGDNNNDAHKDVHRGCLGFLQRAWKKFREPKQTNEDLDSLELFYLLGQCGNQIGGSLWPSILEEYKILTNQYQKNATSHSNSKCGDEQLSTISSFLYVPNGRKSMSFECLKLSDLKENNVKARVICIDMEESVVSRFSNSKLSFLFDKTSIIKSYPGSSNNWAEGYYTHGPIFKDKIMHAVTKYIERCDCLHGILLVYSMGGGTGSGLGSYILEQLENRYPNIERFVACVYATGSEDVITAPYNTMLATQHLIRNATCVFPVENKALQEICDRKRLRPCTEGFRSIAGTFEDMNSIVVKLLLHVTSPAARENNFWNCCSRKNQLLQIDPIDENSVLMASMLLGRGDYTLTDMRTYVDRLQKKAPILEWSKKCMKIGLCTVPPNDAKFSMAALFNTSAIKYMFDHVSEQFQKLLKRKAHVHHYTKVPGFEFDCFYECQNTIADLIDTYEEAAVSNNSTENRMAPTINY